MKLKNAFKSIVSLTLALTMMITVGVQGLTVSGANEENTVVVYDVQECHTESKIATMTVNGTEVPVIDYTDLYDYAHFSFDGTATITVTVNETVETYSVSPLAKNIAATAEANTLTFTITESVYMIVKINGIKEIVVIADALETDVPASSGDGIYNIVNDYGADATGEIIATEAIQSAIDDANAAGGGIVYVPKGLYYFDTSIVLKSNVDMYLEGGAVLRSVADPAKYETFYYKNSLKMNGTWLFYTEENSENISIRGRGIIDGNGYDMRKNYSFLATIVMPIGCSGFTLDGVTLLDGNFWSLIPTRCDNVTITNTKHLNENNDLHENDAIDIVESQNVLVKHTIAMSEDDTYSTKTWGSFTDIAENWYGDPEELRDVTFDDCFGWTHCGTFKLGDGCHQPQTNVTFKNSYSYKCMQAIKVSHGYGVYDFKDVLFENIDIEGFGGRSATDRRWLLIDAFSGDATDNGNVDGLTIRNINIRELGSTPSTLKGRDNQSYVYGLTFENIKVPGQEEYASSLEEMNITDVNIQGTSDYTILPVDNSVDYDTTGNLAVGANVVATSSSNESASYTPDKAIDGSMSTRWTSGATDNEWLVLDFGETVSFNRVRLLWEAAYGTGYKIQYSDDNASWKDAIVITDGDGGTDTLDFDRVSGRYLRFLGTKRVQDKNGFALYEVEVYDHDNYDVLSLPELTVQVRLAKRDYTDNVLRQYTNETAATLKEALTAAEAVVNSDEPTGVTEALRALTTAKAGLVKRTKPTAEYNLALNKPVETSGIQNDTSDSKKAVDGSTTSCWRSQTSGAPYWLTIDLGENTQFDYVAINWEDTYATSYKLQYSDDNENWTDITIGGEVYRAETSKGEKHLYLDEAYTARYIRMYCIQKSTTWGVGIYEMEVYNTADVKEPESGDVVTPLNENLALGKTATASSNDPAYAPSSAVDGSTALTSRWGRSGGNKVASPHWFMVDLGNIYNADTIKIIWENLPESFNIEVSQDGSVWTTVVADAAPDAFDCTIESGDTRSQTDLTFDPVQARYVRINMVAQSFNNNYYLSIFEFEVYSTIEEEPPVVEPEYTKGDVNADGKINSTDFTQVRKYYLGLFELTETQKLAADVNEDGKINSTDFMRIKRHFLGTYTIA